MKDWKMRKYIKLIDTVNALLIHNVHFRMKLGLFWRMVLKQKEWEKLEILFCYLQNEKRILMEKWGEKKHKICM